MQERPAAASRPTSASVRVRTAAATTDTRGRRRRMFTWALLAGAGVLFISAIVGENGYLATLRLQRTEAGIKHTLTRLRLENRRLQDERERLQTDPETIERTIRQELGFVRPGEVTVIVHETPALSPAPPRKP